VYNEGSSPSIADTGGEDAHLHPEPSGPNCPLRRFPVYSLQQITYEEGP